MREIQDMTLQVERGLAQLDRKFAESSDRFSSICRPSTAFALRVTAVPLSPLSIPVPNDTAINPVFQQFEGTRGPQKIRVGVPHSPSTFRPTLRGISARNADDASTVSVEIRDTGFFEIFFLKRQGDGDPQPLYAGWFLGLACNALSIISYLREAAGSPGAEYGLELAVHAYGGLSIAAYGGREYGSATWNFGPTTFPRYSVGDQTHFPGLAELIDRDLWNATGSRGGPPVIIAFP